MLDEMKKGLIGQVIEDVGLINAGGVKYARLILSDRSSPLLVEANSVMITLSSRKRMGKALTATASDGKVKLYGS